MEDDADYDDEYRSETSGSEGEVFQRIPESTEYPICYDARVRTETLLDLYNSAEKLGHVVTSYIASTFLSHTTLGSIIRKIRQLKFFDYPDYPGYLSDEEYLKLIPTLITRLNDLNVRKAQYKKE